MSDDYTRMPLGPLAPNRHGQLRTVRIAAGGALNWKILRIRCLVAKKKNLSTYIERAHNSSAERKTVDSSSLSIL